MSKQPKKQPNSKNTAVPPPAPDHAAPDSGGLIRLFSSAHAAFEGAFTQALLSAKEAGEALLQLQAAVGLKGKPLFEYVRGRSGLRVSDRSCFLYRRVASRWNELRLVAGNDLTDLSLSKAVRLLQLPKTDPDGSGSPHPAPAGPADEGVGFPPPQAADPLTVLAQVVHHLEYLSQEIGAVEDPLSLCELADRVVALIEQIRAKAG